MTDWLLWLIATPVIVALLGLLFLFLRSMARRRGSAFLSWLRGYEPLSRLQAQTIVLYVVFFVVSYLAIIQFGTRFRLTQARYLFPTVNAVAICLALGARTIVPPRFRPYAQGVIVSGLILLTLVIYTKFVIPYWHLTDWDAQ